MKLKATDTLHISAVGPDNIQPGQEFEVSKHIGEELAKRGLATVISDDEPSEEKADEAPPNKAEKAPANKAIIASTSRKKA